MQDHVGLAAVGVDEHVGALRDARRPARVRDAVERRQRLARQDRARPARGWSCIDDPPGLGDLVRVGRAGTRAGPGIARSDASCSTGWWVGPSSPTPIESCVKMWITGISISAESRIGAARVVGEDQEARPERPQLRERQAVRDRRRRVLADRRSGGCARRGRRARSRPRRRTSGASSSTARGRPRRRAATARACATAFSTWPGRVAARDALRVGRERRDVARPSRRAARAAASRSISSASSGCARAVLLEQRLPRRRERSRRARRSRRRSARRRRRGRGTPRPRASRRSASSPRTPSAPSGSPCAFGVSSTGEP